MGLVIPRHALSKRARPLRHARRQRSRVVLRTITLTVVGVLAFVGAGAAATYARMQGNIATVNIDDLVADPQPTEPTVDPTPSATPTIPSDPNAGQAINILLIGSDSRDGDNAWDSGEACNCSDTTIVLHISADRSRAELVSIPRDSLVDIPSCVMTNGETSPPQNDKMFNAAYSTGFEYGGDIASAAACTWRTVEANTGVHLTDYVVIDFTGFRRMVDTLGGVPICVPKDMKSEKADLEFLEAGWHTLDGRQALGFARARTGTGLNGSDINRIGNQQRLLSAMANTAMEKNILTDFPQLLSFLDAVTSSLTTDMSLMDTAGLAYNMRSIGLGNITFTTTPWAEAPQDKNRVVWTKAATELWQRIAADQPIVEPPTAAGPDSTSGQPAPGETRKAGLEPFTAADTTAVCG